jgi:CyaY protein
MTDSEFLTLAEQLLQTVESECDRLNEQEGVDIDNQRTGGMVTLAFSDRSQIVVNLQKPLHEVWLASRVGGYHYRYVGGLWQDTKGQGEFFTQLGQHASLHAGIPVQFKTA